LQETLIKNIVVAQKDIDHAFLWVEFAPQFHSFLIGSALWLIPQLATVGPCQMPPGVINVMKKDLFVYILEILLEGPQKGFSTSQRRAKRLRNGRSSRKPEGGPWQPRRRRGQAQRNLQLPPMNLHPWSTLKPSSPGGLQCSILSQGEAQDTGVQLLEGYAQHGRECMVGSTKRGEM
jgi:hypothetical protein